MVGKRTLLDKSVVARLITTRSIRAAWTNVSASPSA